MTCETTDEFRATVQDFINERKWLKNVSPKTLAWYRDSFKAFEGCETEAAFKARIGELRGRGVAAVSVNSWLRCVNAYLKWRSIEYKLPRLKEEQKILQTLSPVQVKAVLGFKPTGVNLTRAHTVNCLLLDTGLRISEALSLAPEDIDYDSLVLKVVGKGGKHRLVPFSFELRRILYKFSVKTRPRRYFFGTKNDTKLTTRNMHRDLSELGKRLRIAGVRFLAHTMRHTFAVNYLRNGGNVFYLQRILGHSSLEMTSRYVRSLGIEDLQKVHNRLSLLSSAGFK